MVFFIVKFRGFIPDFLRLSNYIMQCILKAIVEMLYDISMKSELNMN